MNNLKHILCAIIFTSLFTCKTSTEPDQIYLNITETDESGQFIGYIDKNDWSESAYINYYFGKKIWIYPNRNIYFTVTDSGQSFEKDLMIYNYDKSAIDINCSIKTPFYFEPEHISIKPRTISKVTVKYHAADTLSYKDSLLITCSDGEEYSKKAQVYYKRLVGERRPVTGTSFFPAYPNPTSGSITFSFLLNTPMQQINLYLKDNDGSVIKTFTYDSPFKKGKYEIFWDINQDHIKPGIYRAFLEADSFSAHGDIQILEY